MKYDIIYVPAPKNESDAYVADEYKTSVKRLENVYVMSEEEFKALIRSCIMNGMCCTPKFLKLFGIEHIV